ncbi:PAS domain S-box protein [Verrucomicrobia bacterium]|nr:PAS domain S-box protein [Verrucomicrobiota bacterium]
MTEDRTEIGTLEERCRALEEDNAALRQQADDYRAITEKRGSAILILDQETILYVNEAWCELHQTSVEYAVGRHIGDFAPPDLSLIDIRNTYSENNSPEMIHFVEHAIRSGRLPTCEEMYARRMNNTPISSSQGLLMKECGELRWMKTQSSLISFSGRQAVLNTEQDITEQVLSEQRMLESEERYRALFEQSIVCNVLMGEDGEQTFNRNVYEVLGYTREEYLKLRVEQTDAIKNSDEVNEHHRRIIEEGRAEIFETKLRHKDGHLIDMLIHISPIKIGGKDYLQNISIDITDRKKAESLLQKAHEELEDRVALRTEELKAKSDSLEETNTALKVLLQKREEDKGALEDRVLMNIRELVIPSVEKLKHTELNLAQQSYLDVLEMNLQDVVSPFLQRLSMKHLKFTPAEIRIANLIKQGRTTKEMASHLNLAIKTIEFHRSGIRGKLGLNKSKANLRSYLLSID